jgi:hypothetical protein
MFADEVIESLTFTLHKLKGSSIYPELSTNYEDLINSIKNSQKFFLGDTFEFFKKAGPVTIPSSVFLDAEDLRLPYPVCWFSCQFPTTTEMTLTKIGVLAKELSKDLLQVDIGLHAEKSWTVIPTRYHVSISCPIREHPVFRQMKDETVISKINPNIRIHGTHYARLEDEESERYFAYDSSESILPFLLLEISLKLLSCKNIGSEAVHPPEKVNKKRRKNGKQELFTYHTLVLKPFGKTQKSVPKNLWENRIHLQRGHFKTYTDQNPLFGKITGRFWWQSHARGQNKSGVVVKDYEFDVSEYSPR